MPIPIYLAMTGAEFLTNPVLPPRLGWMACHFSPGGSGLCNIPQQLPAGSLLIVDDSTPFQSHDCDLILSQLMQAVEHLKPDGILLDFQRQDVPQTAILVDAVIRQLSCPVGVSACYADQRNCPIFLPPGPLDQPLHQTLFPYRGREIWLDAAPLCGQITVTPEGSQYHTLPVRSMPGRHYDAGLHCDYDIQIKEDCILFTLSRNGIALQNWLDDAAACGVTCAVGLYQELHDFLH